MRARGVEQPIREPFGTHDRDRDSASLGLRLEESTLQK